MSIFDGLSHSHSAVYTNSAIATWGTVVLYFQMPDLLNQWLDWTHGVQLWIITWDQPLWSFLVAITWASSRRLTPSLLPWQTPIPLRWMMDTKWALLRRLDWPQSGPGPCEHRSGPDLNPSENPITVRQLWPAPANQGPVGWLWPTPVNHELALVSICHI